MIKGLLIYFLGCGIFMYYFLDNQFKNLNKYDWEIPEEDRERTQEIKQLLFEHLGTAYSCYLPFIYLIGMLLGWLLLPLAILETVTNTIMKLFK